MSFPRDAYPYTNFHELNLGYFIVHFREIFSQWADLYDQMLDWKDATTDELAAWKTGVEAYLDQREAALRAELETWKTQTGQDIAGWEDATLAALTAWQTATQAVFEAIRVEAAGSATAAAASAGDAATAKTAAETAQAAAEAAAASVQASAAQIATNTGDIADLKTQLNPTIKNLQDFAGMNLADYFKRENKTATDVTFTFNADGSCTVVGTAESTRTCDVYKSVDSIPAWLEKEKTYNFTYSATNVRFRIYKYENGTLDSNPIIDTLTSTTFSIPSSATGVLFRFHVSSGKTVNETVSPSIITGISTESIKEDLNDLLTVSMGSFGLFTGSLADVDSNGWNVTTSESTTDLPGSDSVYLVGTMFNNEQHRTGMQIAISSTSGQSYIRRKSANVWGNWTTYEKDLSNYWAFFGSLANNTDLNDITDRSVYTLSSSRTFPNAPVTAFGGSLITMPYSATSSVIQQFAIELDTGNVYYRYRSGSTPTWKPWKNLTGMYATAGKYVAFGDSVTAGAVWDYDQTTQVYTADAKYQIPTRIAVAAGLEKNFVNEGVGGTGYYNRSSAGASVTEKILAYNFSGVNLVTVMAGVNDKDDSAHALGTAENPASGTICGAIKSIIDFFNTNYPKIQLVIIQPTPSGHLSNPYTGTLAAGWSLDDFDDEVSKLCHANHVGYCNWWDCTMVKNWDSFSGGYSYNPSTGTLTGPNYSHMANEADYGILGDYIGGKVSEFYHGRN